MNMKKIAITTDTNSGMMPGDNADQGVFVLPMPFVIDGECLLESVTLSREDFYSKLVGGSKVTTAQPSVGEVAEFWTNILKDYDEIVHIPTSSILSNAYSTAKALAEDPEYAGKVHLVNNRRISTALKSSVFDAVTLRDQGKSATEIVETLEKMYADYSIYLSIETMEYLKRGGRVSPTVAAIGSILKLRPILQLKGEGLEKFGMPRTVVKAKELIKAAIAKDFQEKYKDAIEKGEMRICLVYGENPTDGENIRPEIEKAFPNVPIMWCDPMSLSVACHTGPNTFAITYMRVIR